MVAAICCRADEGTTYSGGATLECLRYCDVEGRNDGTRDGGLCLVRCFFGKVNSFGIAGVSGVESELSVLPRVWRVNPCSGGLEGIFSRLLGESAESPLLRLRRLKRLKFFEEVSFKDTDVGMRGTWSEGW